jgi:signal transduction histidine kinase
MIDSTLKNANILIVDDQQANIDVLTGLLDAKGFTNYKTTNDSRQVIGLLEEFKPDLLLLDLNMPHLTGFQVMIQLKVLIPANTYFPILVLTADITTESKQKALASGASDFLTKPFDLIEVDLRIKNLLKARYLHQQIENQNLILEEKVKERTIELEKTNLELISAKEIAEEMNKLKSIFLANMSHELRTPLISVLGFAELLQLELTNADQLELVDQVLEGGRRLNLTLNSILEWSKLESEKLSLKLSPSNLAVEIHKNIDIYMPLAKAKQLFINSEFSDANLIANIDTGLFDKAFFQLMHNAIKFTTKGGISVTLNQIKKEEVVWAVINVMDTGIGIPRESLDKIFVEFRQSSEGLSRSHEGSGLGLSLAKKMIELMNGKIEIKSEVEKGSTFSIWLPTVLDAAALNLKVEEKIKTIAVEPAIKKTGALPAVLLVEDNPSNRMLVKRMLVNDYIVYEAEDGFTGIALASKNNFNLLLMDINLGYGIDGIETMHEIRKIPGYFKVPIIAVTAYAMFGEKDRLLNEGFDDYVQKPFTKVELINHVKNLVIN